MTSGYGRAATSRRCGTTSRPPTSLNDQLRLPTWSAPTEARRRPDHADGRRAGRPPSRQRSSRGSTRSFWGQKASAGTAAGRVRKSRDRQSQHLEATVKGRRADRRSYRQPRPSPPSNRQYEDRGPGARLRARGGAVTVRCDQSALSGSTGPGVMAVMHAEATDAERPGRLTARLRDQLVAKGLTASPGCRPCSRLDLARDAGSLPHRGCVLRWSRRRLDQGLSPKLAAWGHRSAVLQFVHAQNPTCSTRSTRASLQPRQARVVATVRSISNAS